MDFEQQLKRVASDYASRGYQVVVRPGSEDLPSFAKDFHIEIVGKRAAEGVLVAVKKNREDMAADSNMPRYAEVTGAQPGWRFDFVILEGEEPDAREIRGAQELSDDDIVKALGDAQQLVRGGFLRPALVTAWAGLEAAMRRRIRALRETTEQGALLQSMLNELYSGGNLSVTEFSRLEHIYRLRNEIVHGFASPALDPGLVQFLVETARRLLDESRPVKQTA
jgi:hypothetical protein